MNKIIIVGIVVVVLIGGFVLLSNNETNVPSGNQKDIGSLIPSNQITEKGTDTVVTENEDVIKMNSGSFFFAPNTLKAKVGEETNIDITSSGLHTFTIDELGVDVLTQDGVTTRVTFTPKTAGTYTYYCAIPGHTEAGQIGSLIVAE